MGKKDKNSTSKATSSAENIKVLVRCRPINTKEHDNNYKSCVDLNLSDNTVQVNHTSAPPDRWTFDAVINNTFTQKDIFGQFIIPMIDSVLDGFNATVFAYGQSGSGKTHTMVGRSEGDGELKGITPRTFEYVFNRMKSIIISNPNKSFTTSCSFVELYNGKVRDLLTKQQVPLAVKENKDKTFFVQGVNIPKVTSPEDFARHIDEGNERRQVASTELNADSSRSHSVFTLIIECLETSDDGDVRCICSKLNLVDLAGSERQGKTGASGDTLKEGCNINLSLSALGTVIDTLVKGVGHVPFRSSPLTMLLKDSLGGNSKTIMFANIGPSEHNISETVSTLRFADRAKQIKNKPVINMDSKDQKIAELSEMVAELKEKLKLFETGGVKKLEGDIDFMTDKIDNLQIELDNITHGRETDKADHEETIQHLKLENKTLKDKILELESCISQIKEDADIYECTANDEKKQKEEIWQVCSDYFKDNINNIEDLLKNLDHMANNSYKEEEDRTRAQMNMCLVDIRGERDAAIAQCKEYEKLYIDKKEELVILERRMAKYQSEEEGKRVTLRVNAIEASFNSISIDENNNNNNNNNNLGSSQKSLGSGITEGISDGEEKEKSSDIKRLIKQNEELQAEINTIRNDTLKKNSLDISNFLKRAKYEKRRRKIEEMKSKLGDDYEANSIDIDGVEDEYNNNNDNNNADDDEDPSAIIISQIMQDKKELIDKITRLEHTTSAAITKACKSNNNNINNNNNNNTSALLASLQNTEKDEELAAAHDNLIEETNRKEKIEKEWQQSLTIITRLQEQLIESQREVAATEVKLAEQKADFARASRQPSDQIIIQMESLEKRLRDRSEQLSEMRTTAEKQRGILKEVKMKNMELKQQVSYYKKELDKEADHRQKELQEREESIHRAINKKIEQISQDNNNTISKKDEESHKLRKKIKKLENSLEKTKILYDEQVCEYAELSKRMEEQKMDAILLIKKQELLLAERDMMEPSGDYSFRDNNNNNNLNNNNNNDNNINSNSRYSGFSGGDEAIARAKMAHMKKNDDFDVGENSSELAKVRAAGNAAKALINMRRLLSRERSSICSSSSPNNNNNNNLVNLNNNNNNNYNNYNNTSSGISYSNNNNNNNNNGEGMVLPLGNEKKSKKKKKRIYENNNNNNNNVDDYCDYVL